MSSRGIFLRAKRYIHRAPTERKQSDISVQPATASSLSYITRHQRQASSLSHLAVCRTHSSSCFFFGFSSVNSMLAINARAATAAIMKKMAGKPG